MQAQSKTPPARAYALLALSALSTSLGCDPSASTDALESAPALRDEVARSALPADCEQRLSFRAGSTNDAPYQVASGYEGYQTFDFDIPWRGESVQAVAIVPRVDNTKVVHHFTLSDGTGAHLAHWAPGSEPERVPDDVGRFIPSVGKLKLEIHYYNKNPGAAPEPDRTGFEVCITRTPRKHLAGMYPFAANPVAPAGQVSHSTATCTVTGATPVRVFSHAPHMHKLGTHAKLELLRADGTTEVLHDEAFRFEEQISYPLDVTLQPGDRVRTTCVYANPGTRSVGLGLGSDDEMCFNFVLYHPLCGFTCNTGRPEIDLVVASQNGECRPGGSAVHAHADAGPR
ncbi:MAG: hypothetical protein ABW252_24870 [Polyangiales bacterium]